MNMTAKTTLAPSAAPRRERPGNDAHSGSGGSEGGGRPEDAAGAAAVATGEVGLTILLVAVTMLFIGFTSTYLARRAASDWAAGPMPPVLWVSTAVLVLSSVFLHRARRRARDGDFRRAGRSLWATLGLGLLFVAGQLWAWNDLVAAGVFLKTTAHSAFFYLLTGAHALHLLGGIAALTWAALAARRKANDPGLYGRIRLSGIYWDFLGVLWLYLFALLFLV